MTAQFRTRLPFLSLRSNFATTIKPFTSTLPLSTRRTTTTTPPKLPTTPSTNGRLWRPLSTRAPTTHKHISSSKSVPATSLSKPSSTTRRSSKPQTPSTSLSLWPMGSKPQLHGTNATRLGRPTYQFHWVCSTSTKAVHWAPSGG